MNYEKIKSRTPHKEATMSMP